MAVEEKGKVKNHEAEQIDVSCEEWNREDLGESMLKLYEITELLDNLSELRGIIERDIRGILKEKMWDSYTDNTSKLKVAIKKSKRQTIDKSKLKMHLTQSEISKVVTTIEEEKLELITPMILKKLKEDVQSNR